MKSEEMKVMIKVELELDLETLRTLNKLTGDTREGFNKVVSRICKNFTSSELVEEALEKFEEENDRQALLEWLSFVPRTEENIH